MKMLSIKHIKISTKTLSLFRDSCLFIRGFLDAILYAKRENN